MTGPCTEKSRIDRNSEDIQRLFAMYNKQQQMKIASLGMQVGTLLGVIATILVLVVK